MIIVPRSCVAWSALCPISKQGGDDNYAQVDRSRQIILHKWMRSTTAIIQLAILDTMKLKRNSTELLRGSNLHYFPTYPPLVLQKVGGLLQNTTAQDSVKDNPDRGITARTVYTLGPPIAKPGYFVQCNWCMCNWNCKCGWRMNFSSVSIICFYILI